MVRVKIMFYFFLVCVRQSVDNLTSSGLLDKTALEEIMALWNEALFEGVTAAALNNSNMKSRKHFTVIHSRENKVRGRYDRTVYGVTSTRRRVSILHTNTQHQPGVLWFDNCLLSYTESIRKGIYSERAGVCSEQPPRSGFYKHTSLNLTVDGRVAALTRAEEIEVINSFGRFLSFQLTSVFRSLASASSSDIWCFSQEPRSTFALRNL